MSGDLSQVLKKGTLLIVETGCYSDFGYCGPVRMLGDYTKAELAEEFKKDFKPEPHAYSSAPTPYDFMPWLVRTGKAEDVPAESWHVGDYGDFEP